ncbi:MAG: hypothetical protein HY901_17500, partial [Deltaproteobacteria bacterium]|nr:hypothetical protein [Deltaproteobacteria bacterium]
ARRSERCPGCPLSGGSDEVKVRDRAFRVSSFPIAGRGVAVVHYRDVTDARRLEERLRESQKMASVGQLAAGAAHEINNPLGFLLSNLGTLEGYLQDIRKAFSRMALVQSLVESGDHERALGLLKKQGELIPLSAMEALEDAPAILEESRTGGRRVHEIVKALKELAHESSGSRTSEDPWEILERAIKRVGLDSTRLVTLGRVPARVNVEPLQLEVAFANILRNAVQASFEDAPIQVGTEVEGGTVVTTIADYGCGMSPEVRARMFDPFFTTRGVGGGLGLGLTAAYGVVTRHGGTIDVESEPGCGTEVKVRLPAGWGGSVLSGRAGTNEGDEAPGRFSDGSRPGQAGARSPGA